MNRRQKALLVLGCVIVAATLVVAAVWPASAATIAPSLSSKRVTATLQSDWTWYTPESNIPAPAPRGEFYPRATLGYSFKTLTIGGSVGYGASTGFPVFSAGCRIAPLERQKASDPIASLGMDYVLYGRKPDAQIPVDGGEVRASLNVAKPLIRHFDAVASVGCGLSSRILDARIGLSFIAYDGGAR